MSNSDTPENGASLEYYKERTDYFSSKVLTLERELADYKQLESKLAASESANSELRDALINIEEYWNGGDGSMLDALEHIIDTARKALATTTKK